METKLAQYITEFCSSEHFLLCTDQAHEYCESLLQFWCEHNKEPVTIDSLEKSLRQVAALCAVPLEIRKRFPELLGEFFEYLQSTGRLPAAVEWVGILGLLRNSYNEIFRDNGTLRGTTFRKQYSDVNRNDPCPCGSGKKFKKCCLPLISG